MKDCKYRIVLDSDIFFLIFSDKEVFCVGNITAIRILISGSALNELVDRFFVF